MKNTSANKTTLITGVSSGIGRETALLLTQRGFRVFGTVRNLHATEPITGVELVQMDVTDDASVMEAVQIVTRKAGQIHCLVNNAGYALSGALEETSIEEAREQFETNFFGVLRVTKAVLPGMRQAGYGRIINISSAVGFLPAPHMGIYAASKHALEGYTETLDHEVRGFGVRAVLIEPAFTTTKLGKNVRTAKDSLEAYSRQRERIGKAVQHGMEHGDDPQWVAEGIWKAVTADSPQLRYPVGRASTLSRLRRFVPAKAFDKSFRKQFQLD